MFSLQIGGNKVSHLVCLLHFGSSQVPGYIRLDSLWIQLNKEMNIDFFLVLFMAVV